MHPIYNNLTAGFGLWRKMASAVQDRNRTLLFCNGIQTSAEEAVGHANLISSIFDQEEVHVGV